MSSGKHSYGNNYKQPQQDAYYRQPNMRVDSASSSQYHIATGSATPSRSYSGPSTQEPYAGSLDQSYARPPNQQLYGNLTNRQPYPISSSQQRYPGSSNHYDYSSVSNLTPASRSDHDTRSADVPRYPTHDLQSYSGRTWDPSFNGQQWMSTQETSQNMTSTSAIPTQAYNYNGPAQTLQSGKSSNQPMTPMTPSTAHPHSHAGGNANSVDSIATSQPQYNRSQPQHKSHEQIALDTVRQKALPSKVNSDGKSSTPMRNHTTGAADASPSSEHGRMKEAARTLMQAAEDHDSNGTKATLEAQMKEMFLKMREFNQKDPEMLSRLWQKERDEHMARTNEASHGPPPVDPKKQARPLTQSSSAEKKKKNPKSSSTKAAASTKARAKGTLPLQATSTPSTPTSLNTTASKATPIAPSASSKTVSKTTAPNTVLSDKPPTGSAPTTEQASTPTEPAKKTVWPAGKKASLAQAASTILMGMAGNNGKTLPAAEISTILDGSPNYSELCDQIEAKGVKVDRSQFAKKLLSSVPAAKSNGNASQEQEKRIMNGAELVTTPNKSGRSSKVIVDHSTEAVSERNHTHPQTSAPVPKKQPTDGMAKETTGDPPKASSPTSIKTSDRRQGSKTQSTRRSVTPPLPTKQDLARKRNFTELVDLTLQDSSDEDDIYYPPVKRPVWDDAVMQSLPTPPETTATERSPKIPQLSHNPSLPAGHKALPPADPTSLQLAPPNQTRSSAHETSALPQWHPARKVDMVEPLDKSKALRRNKYDSKSIARDVLIASGRHPDMRHLNAHLDCLKQLWVGVENSSDLNTFRWDIVDPGGPAPGSGAPRLPGQPSQIDIDADDEDSDDDSVLGGSGGNRNNAVRQIVDISGNAAPHGRGSVPGLDSTKGKGRGRGRGRPSVRSHTGHGTPGGTPQNNSNASNSTAEVNRTPSAYTLLRQQQAAVTGEPIKKRGRPVGWRKSMMANPSPYRVGSGNAAAPKKKEPSPRPEYQIYKCGWKGCGAELHNLAVLRRHVHKIHGGRGANGQYICSWNDCGEVVSVNDPTTGRVRPQLRPMAWEGIEQWKDHVEQRHLAPIAWTLGDGPKGGVSDNYESEVSDSYMSDHQGRQVTPRVVISQPSSSIPARSLTKAEKEAEQTRVEAEVRKRNIGPGVDRGGASLVTEKRRQGFVDDEDAMDVIGNASDD